jgi:hypothetical protein
VTEFIYKGIESCLGRSASAAAMSQACQNNVTARQFQPAIIAASLNANTLTAHLTKADEE